MWSDFFLAAIVCIVFLFFPGYFLLRTLKIPRFLAISSAPLIAIFVYSCLAIIYDYAHISANWTLFFIPCVFFGLLVFVLRYLIDFKLSQRRDSLNASFKDALKNSSFRRNAAIFVLYLVFAGGIGVLTYVRALDGPNCFTQTYDDLTHLAVIRGFVDTGTWSSLHVSNYTDFGKVGSYYPAAWHMIAAMLVNSNGISTTMAANVECFVLSAVVYPVGLYSFLRVITQNNKRIMFFGAFLSVAFIAFPWYFLIYGKLVSNLLAFALIPSILALFINVFYPVWELKSGCKQMLVWLIGMACAVFTQPNMVFAVMVFLLPFCVCRIWNQGSQSCKTRSLAKRVCLLVLLVIAFCGVWRFFYSVSFMQSVVTFFWPAASTKIQAICDILFLSTSYTPIQLVLGLFVLIGLFYTFRHRNYLWLTVGYLLFALLYFVCASMEGDFKSLLVGFWYSDKFRISALLAMAAFPLAAMGFAAFMGWLASFVKNRRNKKQIQTIALCAILISLFVPSFELRGVGEIDTPFGYFMRTTNDMYSTTEEKVIFAGDEQDFVEEAAKIVGDDVVLNYPYDGSLFAYQGYGMRVYYRDVLAGEGRNQDEQTIQSSLNNIATDENVQKAVKDINAKYVLLLDYGHEPYTEAWPEFAEENWKGITSITDQTEGFELVLGTEDKRLYKIDTN